MSTYFQTQQTVHTKPTPICSLCGKEGLPLYNDLIDGITDVKGKWNLKQCPNPECALIWLDPAPVESDLLKLYQSYYTHKQNAPKNSQGSILTKMLEIFIKMHPERNDLDSLYLNRHKPGRVLDIGCGDGQRLTLLKSKGWEVYGQDFDPNAAAFSLGKDFKIYLGELKSLKLPDDYFDAVIMNHVIEHLMNPLDVLNECRRILKTGGHFIAVTPNSQSLAHALFKKHWRGLEPPRHIHIFSQKSLKKMGLNTGFAKCQTWTTFANSFVFIRWSLLLQQNKGKEYSKRNLKTMLKSLILYIVFLLLSTINFKGNGDEAVLFATK